VGIIASVTIVFIAASLDGYGLCYCGENYFNYVCLNANTVNHQVEYYLLWATPCIILAILTLVMTIKITVTVRKYKKERNERLVSPQFKAPLTIYYIPFFGFVLYVFDLVFTTIHISDGTSVLLTILNSVIFGMPVVMLVTFYVYKKRILH
jgi:hypothetical protein